MLDVVTVVDDGDDGRRAPQGVMLAVLSQLLKAFGTTYFLRVTLFFDIFSDMLSGIRILSHIFSGILSGILSGISSGILCEWGPVGNTLIMNFNMFFFVVAAAAVTRGAFFSVRTDRTGRKSSNRRFIEALGAQNTVNTDVCCTSEAQTHGIYEVFASGNKNRGNYSVFWPVPSKNTGIYAFLACCKKYRFHAKGTKTL